MYRYIKSNSNDLESSDQFELSSPQQEYDSAKTSINSKKLPAIYNMVSFTPGDVVLDYGGGKFDNAVEYLADKDVTLLVYDPYNRSAAHNAEVVKILRQNGGADATVCSNVLNVIKEPEVRTAVLENIKKLTKSGGDIYITVYEGSRNGKDGPTKSGYQLNRRTEGYVDEIKEVFPDVQRKGKLLKIVNAATSVNYNNKPNEYCTSFRVGDSVRFSHGSGQYSKELGEIVGFDDDGNYIVRWPDGELSEGICDVNLVSEYDEFDDDFESQYEEWDDSYDPYSFEEYDYDDIESCTGCCVSSATNTCNISAKPNLKLSKEVISDDETIYANSDSYYYQMLSRLQQDCEYYLNNGNRDPSVLWSKDEQSHIDMMRDLYNKLDPKPEWISENDIDHYENEMVDNIATL